MSPGRTARAKREKKKNGKASKLVGLFTQFAKCIDLQPFNFFEKHGRPELIFEKAEPGQILVTSTSRFPRETLKNSARLYKGNKGWVGRSSRMQRADMHRAIALMAKIIWNWWD